MTGTQSISLFKVKLYVLLLILMGLPSINGFAQRPNILVIVGDDHGQHTKVYGDPNIESIEQNRGFNLTANLDRIASEGVAFKHHYVSASVCSPSRSTLYTGFLPSQNGQIGLETHNFRTYHNMDTWLSILKNSSYYKTFLLGKIHVDPMQENKLDHMDEHWQPSSFTFASSSLRDIEGARDKVREYIQVSKSENKNFAIALNYPDPHDPFVDQRGGYPPTENLIQESDVPNYFPYMAIQGGNLKSDMAKYYNCVQRMDIGIGMVLDVLNEEEVDENTLVIYIGDNGAAFDRGKSSYYDGGYLTPFIVRWPEYFQSHSPSLNKSALISQADIFPTILDAAGIDYDIPENMYGQSILPILSKTVDNQRSYLISEKILGWRVNYFPSRLIFDGTYKLIHHYDPDIGIANTKINTTRTINGIQITDGNPIRTAALQTGAAVDGGVASVSEEETGVIDSTVWNRYLNPPQHELYNISMDEGEFENLLDVEGNESVRDRLLSDMNDWQEEYNDLFRFPGNVQRLLDEINSIPGDDRSPADGWQYPRGYEGFISLAVGFEQNEGWVGFPAQNTPTAFGVLTDDNGHVWDGSQGGMIYNRADVSKSGSQSLSLGSQSSSAQYVTLDPFGSDGVGRVSYFIRRFSQDTTQIKSTLDYDNGSGWITAMEMDYSGATIPDNYIQVSVSINQPGNVKLRIGVTGIKGLIFDEVSFTHYTPISVIENQTIQEASVVLFPLLSNGQLFLNIKANKEKPIEVQMFDTQGKLVFSKRFNTFIQSVDVSSFKTGLYVVKIKNEEDEELLRFVKNE